MGVCSDSSSEEDSYESTDDGDVSDVSTWIPYQEVCSSTSRLTRVKTSQPSKARYSDRLISTYTSSEGLDFVHPSPNQVLDLMLDSIRIYHFLRYGSYIQQLQVLGRTEQTFLDLLRPAARDVLLSSDYSRENLLTIRGDALRDDEPQAGIYVHILWLKSDPGDFYLYVGQSSNMQLRFDNHRDRKYRTNHPSLHYYVWDNFDINEEFVVLALIDAENPLLLNLLEMWASLMLQTLSKNALTKYLPLEMLAPYAGRHLNVALPILQASPSQAPELHDPWDYHTSDPVVCEYYKSMRRRFYELKFSPNAAHRDYYEGVIRSSVITRYKANIMNLAQILGGIEQRVYVNPRPNGFYQELFINHFKFGISRKWVHLEKNAPIQVRVELLTMDEFQRNGSAPTAYCIKATEKDPASRLSIFVEGTSETGTPFAGWIRSGGQKQVFHTNTFVDLLEGGSMAQSSHLPRRWISTTFERGDGKRKKKHKYTEDCS